MKLHRIRVKDFGRHESCELTLNADGITIINGPNEAGKSSLMRALYYILDEKQTHQRDLKSFIRDGKKGFEIEADIESGGCRFVLTRRYYLKESNSLEILLPEREKVDPAEIDERLQSIMRETMDMDLWRALNKLQGVAGKEVSASGRLADALTKASGEVVEGGMETSYMELVKIEASAYFNENGKENKELSWKRTDLKKMEDDVAGIRREISEADAYLDELEVRSGRRSQLEIDIANQRIAVAENNARFAAAKALASDLRVAEDAAKKHRALAGLLKQRLEDRRADEKSVQEMRSQITALRTRLSGLPSLEAMEKENTKAAIAAADGSSREKACLENARRAQQDLDHLRRLNDLGILQDKLRSVAESREKARVAEEELQKNAVTEEMMKQIIAANNKVQSAEGALTSKLPSIHLEAISQVNVSIAGEAHNMASGEILGRTVDGKLEVVIPGTMRIVVLSSAEEKPQERLDKARDALMKLLGDCGVITVEQAQAASRRRMKSESELERAEEHIKSVLGKEKVEEIEVREAQMSSLIDAYKKEREESTLPSDLDQAEERLKNAEKAHRSAVKEADKAAEAATKAAEALAKLTRERSELVGQIGALESTMAESEESLRRSREMEGDEEMEKKSELAETEERRLDSQVNDMRAQAAGLKVENLERIVKDAEAALDVMLEEQKRNNDEMLRLKGRLEGKADEGAEERLGERVANLERAQREFSALLRRAQAAQLLKRVMEEEKSKAMIRYKQPLKQRVEEMGRLLHGATFSIAMDDNLNITGRSLDGKFLEFGQLSEGAKEQLGIMLRLACADVVAPVCGMPLILDDPLSNTDPRRLRVMNSLLSLAGRKGQLILITCNPGKYAGIGNAKRVEMGAEMT